MPTGNTDPTLKQLHVLVAALLLLLLRCGYAVVNIFNLIGSWNNERESLSC
jgi:hypothetical protein